MDSSAYPHNDDQKKTKIFHGSTFMLLRDGKGEAVAAFPVDAYRFMKESKEVTYWFLRKGECQIAVCVDKHKFKEDITAEVIKQAEFETYDTFGSLNTSDVFEHIELKIKPTYKKPEKNEAKKKRKLFSW